MTRYLGNDETSVPAAPTASATSSISMRPALAYAKDAPKKPTDLP